MFWVQMETTACVTNRASHLVSRIISKVSIAPLLSALADIQGAEVTLKTKSLPGQRHLAEKGGRAAIKRKASMNKGKGRAYDTSLTKHRRRTWRDLDL